MSCRWLCLLLALACLTCSFAAADGGDTPWDGAWDNPDVIAWIEIPGAQISEPVLRHPTDDAYYATHLADGTYDAYGSVYVQAGYNGADFSDSVTLLYGSSAAEGAPFRMLQEMYSGSFDQCRRVLLHTPQGTQEYIVFAAVPYTSIHILHYYDFSSSRRFDAFFDGVYSTRALGMHLDEDMRPEAGVDQVIILSTALRGDSLQRYLVMARKVTP
nr:class B sortase [Clostridia bacterium]